MTHINQQKFLRTNSARNEGLISHLLQDSGVSDGFLAQRSEISLFDSHNGSMKKKSCCQDVLDESFHLWLGAFAEYSYEKPQHQTPPFHAISEGTLLAFDCCFPTFCQMPHCFSDAMIGGAIGYANSYIHEGWHFGHASSNYYYSSLYGMIQSKSFYIEGVIWGGYQQIKNERHIAYPGYKATATARYHAWQLSPHMELGADIDMSWGCLQPFAAFEYANTWQEEFQEHGAVGMNMKEQGHHSSMLRSAIGLRAFEYWCWNWGSLMVKEEIDYVNKSPFRVGKVPTSLIGGLAPVGSFLLVETLTATQNLGSVGCEFLFQPRNKKCPEFSLGYYGEFGAKYFGQELIFKIVESF